MASFILERNFDKILLDVKMSLHSWKEVLSQSLLFICSEQKLMRFVSGRAYAVYCYQIACNNRKIFENIRKFQHHLKLLVLNLVLSYHHKRWIIQSKFNCINLWKSGTTYFNKLNYFGLFFWKIQFSAEFYDFKRFRD